MGMRTKIDEAEAITFAKSVLNNAERLRRIAGKQYGALHSVAQDGMPHAKGNGHELEGKLIRQIDAAKELQGIQDAIDVCTHDSKILLNKRYMTDSLSNVQVYVELGYSETAYYRHVRKAYVEFAEAFRGY